MSSLRRSTDNICRTINPKIKIPMMVRLMKNADDTTSLSCNLFSPISTTTALEIPKSTKDDTPLNNKVKLTTPNRSTPIRLIIKGKSISVTSDTVMVLPTETKKFFLM